MQKPQPPPNPPTYKISPWIPSMNAQIPTYRPFLQQVTILPCFNRTHILAHQLYPAYTITHINEQGKKLSSIRFGSLSNTFAVEVVRETYVVVLKGMENQKGRYEYTIGIWDLQSYGLVEFQHMSWVRKERCYGMKIFYFQDTDLLCIADRIDDQQTKLPQQFVLTYYKFIQCSKTAPKKPLQSYRYQLTPPQSLLNPTATQANQHSSIAFPNQHPNKNPHQPIAIKIFSLTRGNMKGGMRKYQFEHGLGFGDMGHMVGVVVRELWELDFPVFYIRVETRVDLGKCGRADLQELFQGGSQGSRGIDRLERQAQYLWDIQTSGGRSLPYKPAQKYYKTQFIQAPRQITQFTLEISPNPGPQQSIKPPSPHPYPIYYISKQHHPQSIPILHKTQTEHIHTDLTHKRYPVLSGSRVIRYEIDYESISVWEESLEEMKMEMGEGVGIVFLMGGMLKGWDQELLRVVVELLKGEGEGIGMGKNEDQIEDM